MQFDMSSALSKLDTGKRVEFADVRGKVSLKQLTDYLAIQLAKKGEAEFRGQCPQCRKDNRSLSINFAKNYFRCFTKGCPFKGSGVIDFLAKAMN